MHQQSIFAQERTWEVEPASRFSSMMRFAWLIILTIAILAGCTRPASQSPINATAMMVTNAPGTATNPARGETPQITQTVKPGRTPAIRILQVNVSQGDGIYVTGESDLPAGACIKTELLANRKSLEWWPRDICVEAEAGRWELLVALGRSGAPTRLETNVEYEIHAWWPEKAQETSTRFPFDLDGPPAP